MLQRLLFHFKRHFASRVVCFGFLVYLAVISWLFYIHCYTTQLSLVPAFAPTSFSYWLSNYPYAFLTVPFLVGCLEPVFSVIIGNRKRTVSVATLHLVAKVLTAVCSAPIIPVILFCAFQHFSFLGSLAAADQLQKWLEAGGTLRDSQLVTEILFRLVTACSFVFSVVGTVFSHVGGWLTNICSYCVVKLGFLLNFDLLLWEDLVPLLVWCWRFLFQILHVWPQLSFLFWCFLLSFTLEMLFLICHELVMCLWQGVKRERQLKDN